jgi:hypothetical protein
MKLMPRRTKVRKHKRKSKKGKSTVVKQHTRQCGCSKKLKQAPQAGSREELIERLKREIDEMTLNLQRGRTLLGPVVTASMIADNYQKLLDLGVDYVSPHVLD